MIKTFFPISLTFLEILNIFIFLQPSKACCLIKVTLLGIVKEVKPVQSLKAFVPIAVVSLESFTEVRLTQPSKALCAIFVTFLGIVIFFRFVQPEKVSF